MDLNLICFKCFVLGIVLDSSEIKINNRMSLNKTIWRESNFHLGKNGE